VTAFETEKEDVHVVAAFCSVTQIDSEEETRLSTIAVQVAVVLTVTQVQVAPAEVTTGKKGPDPVVELVTKQVAIALLDTVWVVPVIDTLRN